MLAARAIGFAGVVLAFVGIVALRSDSRYSRGIVPGIMSLALGLLMTISAISYTWLGTSDPIGEQRTAVEQTPVPQQLRTPSS